MEIQKKGENTFVIKGNKSRLLINPTKTGQSLLESEVVVDIGKVWKGEGFRITSEGEYEVQGLYVELFGMKGEDFKIISEVENVVVGLVRDETLVFSKEIMEEMTAVDVLVIYVKSDEKSDVKKVWDIANEIEPNILIPYSSKDNNFEEFKTVFGIKEAEKVSKLKVKKSEVSPGEEGVRVVFMQ